MAQNLAYFINLMKHVPHESGERIAATMVAVSYSMQVGNNQQAGHMQWGYGAKIANHWLTVCRWLLPLVLPSLDTGHWTLDAGHAPPAFRPEPPYAVARAAPPVIAARTSLGEETKAHVGESAGPKLPSRNHSLPECTNTGSPFSSCSHMPN